MHSLYNLMDLTSKYFLGRKCELVDFTSFQFHERPSNPQTERQRLTPPNIKWEKRSVSNKSWSSNKHPEHQKGFCFIKSSHMPWPLS